MNFVKTAQRPPAEAKRVKQAQRPPRWWGGVLVVLILATFLMGLAGLTGCATVSPWEKFQAQRQRPARILWESADGERLVAEGLFLEGKSPSVASGEAASSATPGAPPASGAAEAPGAVVLMVGKGQPLLELHWGAGVLTARGRLARGGWRGRIENAPAELADWGWLLPAWVAVQNMPGQGNQEIHTSDYRMAWQREGRRLRGFHLQPTGRSTRFTVQFLSDE